MFFYTFKLWLQCLFSANWQVLPHSSCFIVHQTLQLCMSFCSLLCPLILSEVFLEVPSILPSLTNRKRSPCHTQGMAKLQCTSLLQTEKCTEHFSRARFSHFLTRHTLSSRLMEMYSSVHSEDTLYCNSKTVMG